MDDIDSVGDMLEWTTWEASVTGALPDLLLGLGIFLGGLLFAWVLGVLVRRGARRAIEGLRAGTGALWARGLEARGTSETLGRAAFWIVAVLALLVAFQAWGLPTVTDWASAVVAYVPRVLLAAAILVAGIAAGRVATGVVQRMATGLEPGQARSLGRVAAALVVTVAALMAAAELGLDVSFLTTVFLLVAGAALAGAGIAFGFGARGIVSNIVSMHYVSKSLRRDDRIRIGSHEGRVLRLTPTSVVIDAEEGEVDIPGRHFSEDACVRVTREDRRVA